MIDKTAEEEVRILKNVGSGHAIGSTIRLKFTKPAKDGGIPVERFWARRLRDSTRDACIEVVTPKPKATKGDE